MNPNNKTINLDLINISLHNEILIAKCFNCILHINMLKKNININDDLFLVLSNIIRCLIKNIIEIKNINKNLTFN